ncbi:hypothetical protein NHX12_014141 [Muraenolepis orangiensis]|uniref:C-type lectin n=1 Tax=Muraenolepis orangiensis TaxID=630683 RepID=A0A9Q0DEZ8_9TELE|nr:hypothetical protein NHX12_014141 [Muraenolepis orangiensis]
MRGALLPLLLLLVERSQAAPVTSNSTLPSLFNSWSRCQTESQNASQRPGAYIPQCDGGGMFTPQQCWGTTGYCWCVNVYTGEEIPGTRTPPGTLPTQCSSYHDNPGESGDSCPPGWRRHDTRCFIFMELPTSWIQAQSYCMFVGGSLVSVHSYEEEHFLQELTMGATPPFPRTWIGAHDCIQVGVWMWTDGSMFDYDNFPGYSMNHTHKTCVEMNCGVTRSWTESSCDSLMPYICAKDI